VARSRVELFEQIRKDRRVEGASIRELAGRHQVHRRTVWQALASAVPPPRQPYPQRPRPAVDAHGELINSWLLADKQVPRKRRHTARRIWRRLVAEQGASLSEVMVLRYVARSRAELGLDHIDVVLHLSRGRLPLSAVERRRRSRRTSTRRAQRPPPRGARRLLQRAHPKGSSDQFDTLLQQRPEDFAPAS
jgi:hypothetical protein